ncbi:MAG TPA: transcription-repair coupling factor, partial [Actinomycetota bacterium]
MGLRSALDVLAASPPFERLLLARERPIVARAGASEPFAIAGLAVALGGPILAAAPGPREAETLHADVAAFLGAEGVRLLPAWEALPYEGISPSPEVAARRAEAARALRAATGPFVLVAPALAAMHGVVPTLGAAEPLVLARGVESAPDAVVERLVDLGYTRSDVVEHRGEFAVRGGVLDVFGGTARRPVRLEYWGDEIESIREFSPSTQLSTSAVAAIELAPVRELVLDDALRARARSLAGSDAVSERHAELLARVGDGLHPEGMESIAPLLFDRLQVPSALLPPGAWVVVSDAVRT